nr:glycosyltransferase [Mucilaginibacter sp. L294]
MPLLSVIVTVYNKEEYLRPCLQSILNQTFVGFELILVNDGSIDKSTEICDDFARRDKRVFVIHQKNKGVSEARNAGINYATGKYIGFVDCDDTLEPDMYATLINNAVGYDADVSICGVRKEIAGKIELYYNSKRLKTYNTEEALAALLKKEFLRSVYDKIYEAGIAKKIKFEGAIYEDTFYNFRVLCDAKKVVFEDVIKYNYIVRDNSVSMSKFNTKYMDTVEVSKKILDICRSRFTGLINEALIFDLITNISLLNTILLAGKNNHKAEYDIITKSLNTNFNVLPNSQVSAKHRYSLNLFKFSPFLYEMLMRLYCKIIDADVSKKT